MIDATAFEVEIWPRLQRFGKSPKGLLIGILAAFVILAAPFIGAGLIH